MLDEKGVKQIVEALLFASSEPLPLKKIKEIIGDDCPVTAKELYRLIESLRDDYKKEGRGFQLEETNAGYLLKSHMGLFSYVSRLKPERRQRLSHAASEVLAIVAYRQPVTRHEVELIRGVESGGHFTALQESKLIEVVGKKEVPGRPSLFATTDYFLQHFGLKSLSDLPKL